MSRDAERIAVGIVGFGKIARDRHVAALEESPAFRLTAIADPVDRAAPVERYLGIERMLAADDAPAAVAICTPPQARHRLARFALTQGIHVLLEKPPTATLGELEDLRALAASAGVTLFCAWHSRFAPAVAPAREWLAARRLRRMRIDWREDARVWHPGQEWIWQPGGFGVFDPGINALSIASRIHTRQLFLRDALLRFPVNCAAPIAAELELEDAEGAQVTASFDFRQVGREVWALEAETEGGHLLLTDGGRRLMLDGREVELGPRAEYPAIYARFADLIAAGRSDVDAGPLALVADAFLRARRESAPAFVDPRRTVE